MLPTAGFAFRFHTEKTVFGEKPCLCATRYMSVLVFGKAYVVNDADEKIVALNALTGKLLPGNDFKRVDAASAERCSVIAVRIEKINDK